MRVLIAPSMIYIICFNIFVKIMNMMKFTVTFHMVKMCG